VSAAIPFDNEKRKISLTDWIVVIRKLQQYP